MERAYNQTNYGLACFWWIAWWWCWRWTWKLSTILPTLSCSYAFDMFLARPPNICQHTKHQWRGILAICTSARVKSVGFALKSRPLDGWLMTKFCPLTSQLSKYLIAMDQSYCPRAFVNSKAFNGLLNISSSVKISHISNCIPKLKLVDKNLHSIEFIHWDRKAWQLPDKKLYSNSRLTHRKATWRVSSRDSVDELLKNKGSFSRVDHSLCWKKKENSYITCICKHFKQVLVSPSS